VVSDKAGGLSMPALYCPEGDRDGDLDNVAGADAKKDLETFAAECRGADEAVRARSLDHTFARANRQVSLRWVYVHMIEEYARHNGHADLLRERIDGVTGD
jgi:Protein of unknown function (DUF664)